jgi:hypothetical protein
MIMGTIKTAALALVVPAAIVLPATARADEGPFRSPCFAGVLQPRLTLR